jgi:hypothetical protein
MKRLIFNILQCIILLTGFACSDMNDLHDKYLVDGETTYIGRVDSAKMYPGNERVMIQYWITDPRAKELQVFWSNKSESITIDIPSHQPEDTLEFFIDPINEGDHEFLFLTNDKEGNSSVKYEVLQTVYGPIYETTLNNRPIEEILVNDNALSITWGGSFSLEELGVIISYFSNEGANETDTFETAMLNNPVTLENVDFTKSVQYQTFYLPSPEAIDTFMTEMTRLTIRQRVNVALNKPVSCSNYVNEKWIPEHAVDGVHGVSASRWITDSSNNEHWLEVDLEEPYAIDGFKTYTGASDGYSYATANFEFQVEIDGEWVTIVSVENNSDPKYGADFESVTTSKVRYYVPAYTNNQIRLYELEVFTTIEY